MIRVAKTLGLILLIFIISISSNIVAIELEESFKFCDEENKSTKQEIVCNQDELYKSIIKNPLFFVIFYLIAVFFLAFFFQFYLKTLKRNLEKNDKHDK